MFRWNLLLFASSVCFCGRVWLQLDDLLTPSILYVGLSFYKIHIVVICSFPTTVAVISHILVKFYCHEETLTSRPLHFIKFFNDRPTDIFSLLQKPTPAIS